MNPVLNLDSEQPVESAQNSDQEATARFGTFAGVFTPCTLTILGVIMFLRFGYVVGQAGILSALVIVAASKAITFLTSLSLSAISTNTRVKGGGAYYLISRSLGVEFGGAIGVVFFFAQAISVAMYVIGFSEALVAVAPSGLSPTVVATITNVVVFVCVFIGAGWTIKVQYVILAALGLALLLVLHRGVCRLRHRNDASQPVAALRRAARASSRCSRCSSRR